MHFKNIHRYFETLQFILCKQSGKTGDSNSARKGLSPEKCMHGLFSC